MAYFERAARWFRPAVFLGNNLVTLTGAVLTTSAAFTMISLWGYELLSGVQFHPYVGIVLFLVLPGIFVLGLLLMPLGAFLQWRKLRSRGTLPAIYPKVDLREPVYRRAAQLVALATFANIVLLGTASYRGVEYMNSAQFCGETCHTVMQPEFTAHARSPHSRVGCVDCHIGPGAPWFVRSKLSGVRQVFAVTFKTYSTPIPTPVENLRPARETCEQCHWPQKFHGDKFLVRTKYGEDEKNTPSTTVMILKIGGRTWQGLTGIHGRHLDENSRITYLAVKGRTVIPRVTYVDDEGKTVEYVDPSVELTPDELAKAERRTMDCVDCHNRPTHIFEMPEGAVDTAMTEKRINAQLPFAKQKSLELLRANYASREEAAERIPAQFADYYRTKFPEVYSDSQAEVDAAGKSLRDIYLANIFPAMKVTWGTYPSFIGHPGFAGGCLRCHAGNHVATDGRAISSDCAACHTVLAMDEQNPKVLKDLGIN